METEKLYYADPFLTDFTATVLDCQPGKNGYLVTLDRTAFYPEGGGQPADHGVLDGAVVTDVHEKNSVILHNVDRAVEIGKTVAGAIDWGRRFDHMQQHSGEHICSGLICERFHCDNVGFHMGADIVTIDFNADISWEELLEIEAKANQYLYENHPIDIQFHRGAELDKIDYRSKKPLIVTTNLTLTDLKNPQDVAHARIYDRLRSMCSPICFAGENLRQQAAAQKTANMRALMKSTT